MAESTDNPFRALPPVNAVVDEVLRSPGHERTARAVVVRAAGEVLDECRASIRAGDREPRRDELLDRVSARLTSWSRPPLVPVINATGIMLHTGLGRAPLADAAVAALVEIGGRYAPVELDMVTGDRGDRSRVVRDALVALTGAESAVVVNNTAAALTVVLAAVARDRAVLVSRGELIEIGGSFRLPEIIAAGGARLLEVGTTNRTRIDDYAEVLERSEADVGAILKVHTSNYRIEGFTENATTAELAPLARRHGVALVDDIGSGALAPMGQAGAPPTASEPDARSALEAGADLVLFSGDKLLGGPQAGIIVGGRDDVDRVARHPLMRAMRVDKLVLAALGATLQIHRDPERARRELPLQRMLEPGVGELIARAERVIGRVDATEAAFEIRPARAHVGGGSVPGLAVDSIAIVVTSPARSEHHVARALRAGVPPVVARVNGGAVWIDLRTVFPEQDDDLAAALGAALSAPGT